MKRDNIFQIAHNALNGKYGPEDLLTDSFGTLLSLDKQSANSWVELVTGIKPDKVTITTQPPFPKYPHDAPDMLIEAAGMVLVCEHKIDATLGYQQLERYLALVKKEQARQGIPHRLVVVSQNRLSIPRDIVTDEHYCRPADGANHYLWKDIFILLRQLQIHDKEKTIYEKLRAQFMLHLRSLGLAPIELPKGFIPVNSNNTPEEKEQQYAFGEAWSLTRNWLEEKGFRTNLSSRTGLYIWPTPFSEISDHKGLHHILISPYEKIKTRHIVDFDPPVLDFTVSLEAESKNKIFSQMREVDRLDYLDLPLLIGDLKKIKHGPRILFATPLTPLLESDDLPKVLLSVTKEIYNQFLIPMF